MVNDGSGSERLTADERRRIENAVERGIAAYIASRKEKIPAFIDRYFSFRGAIALQRRTFARDFYKLPLNMLWALPAFVVQCTGSLCERLGARKLGQRLGAIPSGLTTRFQQEINWLIQTELLELPCIEASRSSGKDALLEAILCDPELSAQCLGYLSAIEGHTQDLAFKNALESKLREYGKSKLAISELAGNIMTLAAGFAAFQKATLGPLSAATATATAIAQQIAIANFWLGPGVGAWYYAVFPASASIGLMAATTGALMAATGILAALSLVVLDPLLAKTGFHRRRLERFVDALADQLTGRAQGPYQVKDQYIGRVFDLVDLLKLAAQAAR